MAQAALERYHARMQRVLDHIDQHLDEDLGLERLSEVAAFSKHHFHRQFTALFGISVHRYVRLLRLKRATYQLAFGESETVTDIAMDAGYETPEAFARAFRRHVGQAPSEFRNAPDWAPWLTAFEPLSKARSSLVQTAFTPDQVRIIDTAPIAIARMAHRGAPGQLDATIQRFIAWRRARGLHPKTSATYTVFHDPSPATPEAFHIDLCVGASAPIAADGQGVEPGVIPGGRCAVLRIVGPADDLEPASLYLYRQWLPASGEETRDFPLYCQRVSFVPEVPEHEAVTDLFLPLR